MSLGYNYCSAVLKIRGFISTISRTKPRCKGDFSQIIDSIFPFWSKKVDGFSRFLFAKRQPRSWSGSMGWKTSLASDFSSMENGLLSRSWCAFTTSVVSTRNVFSTPLVEQSGLYKSSFDITIYNGELNASINGVVNNVAHVYGLVWYNTANKRNDKRELNVLRSLNK